MLAFFLLFSLRECGGGNRDSKLALVLKLKNTSCACQSGCKSDKDRSLTTLECIAAVRFCVTLFFVLNPQSHLKSTFGRELQKDAHQVRDSGKY